MNSPGFPTPTRSDNQGECLRRGPACGRSPSCSRHLLARGIFLLAASSCSRHLSGPGSGRRGRAHGRRAVGTGGSRPRQCCAAREGHEARGPRRYRPVRRGCGAAPGRTARWGAPVAGAPRRCKIAPGAVRPPAQCPASAASSNTKLAAFTVPTPEARSYPRTAPKPGTVCSLPPCVNETVLLPRVMSTMPGACRAERV